MLLVLCEHQKLKKTFNGSLFKPGMHEIVLDLDRNRNTQSREYYESNLLDYAMVVLLRASWSGLSEKYIFIVPRHV